MSKLKVSALSPGVALLSKLGSLILHADEYHCTGHPIDLAAFNTLLCNDEVQEWLRGMRVMALLPVKRSDRG